MKKLILHSVLILLAVMAQAQIGLNNPDPDSSAVLDIKSTDRGILIPRMTTTQRLAMDVSTPAPVEGLMVFDTDQERFYFWNDDDNKWYALNPFDYSNQNLVESDVLALNTTNVGVGTDSPVSKLDVSGNMAVGSNYAGTNAATSNGLIVEGDMGIATNTPTANLSVEGNTVIADDVTAGMIDGAGSVPLGGILMWSGSSVPSGFVLCDGNGGTPINGVTIPDLSGRFLVGKGKSVDGATTYVSGDVGGEETHVLSLSEFPTHNHGNTGTAGSHSHDYHGYYSIKKYTCAGCHSNRNVKSRDKNSGDPDDYAGEPAGSHSHTVSSQGGGGAHENRPPFYVLNYIIRVQ